METNKEVIIVLQGGFSPEREVSLVSGREISNSLSEAGYKLKVIDPVDFDHYYLMVEEILKINPMIVFIALHGGEGENGEIQALFDLHHIPYTGSDSKTSALAMDKFLSSEIVHAMDIPTPPKILIKDKLILDEVINMCTFPIVIKPNSAGSSVGIFIIQNESELANAFAKAKEFDDHILIEEYIFGRELTVTVLDGDALPVVEIIPQSGWYDFENKYTKGNTKYKVPADITDNETKLIKSYATNIFTTFDCRSYARIDFRYNNDKFFFLEINTLPGMTPLSLTPMAAKEKGMKFIDLLENIIKTSLK